MPAAARAVGALIAAALAVAAGPALGLWGPMSASGPAPAPGRIVVPPSGGDGPLPAGVTALVAPTQEGPAPGPAYGTYAWPVRGPVLRGFDPPDTPFGSGHRGIDIGAPLGITVVAAQEGTVAFAGPIGGNLFVSIDHPDGVRTTYSWLSEIAVSRGAKVERGDPIGHSGAGHPGSAVPHLHLGARIGSVYIDPMLLLERSSLVGLVRLAPLEEQ